MTFNRPSLLSVADIARMAGVGVSAVSNWKSRWPDFPTPSEGGLYPIEDVEAWLRLHQKEVHPLQGSTASNLLWRAADALRATASTEDALELVIQLVALRAASRGAIERLRSGRGLWDRLLRDPDVPVAQQLQHAADVLGRADADIAELFEPSGSANRIPGAQVRPIVDAVNQLELEDSGAIASELIAQYTGRFGLRAGEHVTPATLADVYMGLLEPIEGAVYDPASGAGVLLAEAWRRRARNQETRLYGQEINVQAWRLSGLHLLLNDAIFEFELGDTLLSDRFWDLKADRVVAQPPLNQRLSFPGSLQHDPRWQWGVHPSTADWLWVQQVAAHLREGGIGVVSVPPSALERGGPDAMIRRHLLESDLLDVVVQLPPAMVPSTSIPLSLLVLQRGRRRRTGRVLFFDLGRSGVRERRSVRRLQPKDVRDLVETVAAWRLGRDPSSPGLAVGVDRQVMLAQDAVLAPRRHMEYSASGEAEALRSRFRQLSEALDDQLRDLPVAAEALAGELARIEEVE